ncbi:MAG TPA: retropepsin-like aspartic protease [Nitrososphaeraceae archaeon]|nr:retropepsin-like aspartic protease [Nitrososphaeraceae archaeon]
MLADRTTTTCDHKLENAIIKIQDFEEQLDLDITILECYDIVLGKPWLMNHNPSINWRTNETTIFNTSGDILLQPQNSGNKTLEIQLITSTQLKRLARKNHEVYSIYIQEVKDKESLPEYPEHVQKILNAYQDVFPVNLPKGLPPERDVDHRIDLEPGASPLFHPVYPLSYAELDELKKQLTEYLSNGMI